MKRFSAKLTPSPSMVVAMIALVVALSGSAYAAVTINGKNIKKGTITAKQVKDKSLTGTDIKDASITGKDVKDASIGSGDLDAGAKAALTGPKGDAGTPGTARAYAQVDQGTDAFVAARTKGFLSVSTTVTGVYCLKVDPATGIDPAKTAAVATPEFGSSSGAEPRTVEIRGINTNSCAADEFAVHTFANGVASSGVSFMLLVP